MGGRSSGECSRLTVSRLRVRSKWWGSFCTINPHGREANCQLYTGHVSGWSFVSLVVALQFDASPKPGYHLTFYLGVNASSRAILFLIYLLYPCPLPLHSRPKCCFILIHLHEVEPHFRLLSLEHKQKFARNFRSWHTTNDYWLCTLRFTFLDNGIWRSICRYSTGLEHFVSDTMFFRSSGPSPAFTRRWFAGMDCVSLIRVRWGDEEGGRKFTQTAMATGRRCSRGKDLGKRNKTLKVKSKSSINWTQ